MPDEAPPEVPYWDVWIDAEGISRQTRRTITSFDLREVAAGAAPVWVDDLPGTVTGSVLAVLPAGVVGEWHENPVPQWIAVISGRWFVETMDGTRVEMGAGELSFGGDQGTRSADGRCGHRSGALDGQPAALLLVQVDRSKETS